MTQALTKAEELSALRRLAEELGPNSYLGPWLQDALPYLRLVTGHVRALRRRCRTSNSVA